MKKFKISYDLLKGGTAFLTSLENDLEFKLNDTHIDDLFNENVKIDEKYNLIKNIFQYKLIYNLYRELNKDEFEKFKELLNNFSNDIKKDLISYLVMEGDYKNNGLDPIDFQKAYLKYGHDINSDLSLQTETQKHLEEFIFNESKRGSWYFKKLADMIERIRYIYELENELVVILLKNNNISDDSFFLNKLIDTSKKKKNIFSYIYLSNLKQQNLPSFEFILNYYFPTKIYDNNNFDELVGKLIKHEELNNITINLIEAFITSDITKSPRFNMRSEDFNIICLKNVILYKNIDLLYYFMQKNIPFPFKSLIIESLINGNDTITLELIKKYISENNENFNENIVEKFKNGDVTELKNIVKETDLADNNDLLSKTNTIDNADLLIKLELYTKDDLINALYKSIIKKNVELTNFFVNKVEIKNLFEEKGTLNDTAFDLANNINGKNREIIFEILYNKIKTDKDHLDLLKQKSKSNERMLNLIENIEKKLKIN